VVGFIDMVGIDGIVDIHARSRNHIFGIWKLKLRIRPGNRKREPWMDEWINEKKEFMFSSRIKLSRLYTLAQILHTFVYKKPPEHQAHKVC